MSLSNTVLSADIAESVKKSLEASGVPVSGVVVKLIIDEYLSKKKQYLLDGKSVSEDGIGVMSVSWRRLPESFSSKRYTTKLKVDMDENLKKMTNEIMKSEATT